MQQSFRSWQFLSWSGILWNPKVFTVFTIGRHTFQSSARLIQTSSHPVSSRYILTLPFHPRLGLARGTFPSGAPTDLCKYFSHAHASYIRSRSRPPPDLPNNTGKQYRSWRSSPYSSLHPPVTSFHPSTSTLHSLLPYSPQHSVFRHPTFYLWYSRDVKFPVRYFHDIHSSLSSDLFIVQAALHAHCQNVPLGWPWTNQTGSCIVLERMSLNVHFAIRMWLFVLAQGGRITKLASRRTYSAVQVVTPNADVDDKLRLFWSNWSTLFTVRMHVHNYMSHKHHHAAGGRLRL